MHDIRFIRDNPEAFDAGLARRGLAGLSREILAFDQTWRSATAQLQEMQSVRNDASKKIGQAKAQKNEAEAQRLMAEVARLKDEVPATETRVRESEEALNGLLSSIPNLPAADVPEGADENDHRGVARCGKPPTEPAPPHAAFAASMTPDNMTLDRVSIPVDEFRRQAALRYR